MKGMELIATRISGLTKMSNLTIIDRKCLGEDEFNCDSEMLMLGLKMVHYTMNLMSCII